MLETCWKVLEVVGKLFGVPTSSNKNKGIPTLKALIYRLVGLLEVKTQKQPTFF